MAPICFREDNDRCITQGFGSEAELFRPSILLPAPELKSPIKLKRVYIEHHGVSNICDGRAQQKLLSVLSNKVEQSMAHFVSIAFVDLIQGRSSQMGVLGHYAALFYYDQTDSNHFFWSISRLSLSYRT